MRSGADSELTSGLSGAEVEIIRQAPGLARDGQNALASAELYVIIDLPKKSALLVGQRADARHRADRHVRYGPKCRSSRAGCSASAPTR